MSFKIPIISLLLHLVLVSFLPPPLTYALPENHDDYYYGDGESAPVVEGGLDSWHVLFRLPPSRTMQGPTNTQHIMELQFHQQFEKVYDDGGSGARLDGSFWKPVNLPEGFKVISHLAIRGHWLNSDRVVIVKPLVDDILAKPTGFNFIYNDRKTGARMDLSIFYPIPPKGYKCLSDVAISGHPGLLRPEDVEIWCVRQDLVAPGVTNNLAWNDGGSGGAMDGAMWQIDAADLYGLSVNGFTTVSNYDIRPSDQYKVYVLKDVLKDVNNESSM